MATNIRGTDGNVALPAFSGNDLDTGVYFPSAGNVAIATNGVNAVTINETQNATFANAVSATSVNAGSATLTTPLSIASGGTGSNTATFSGANITSLNASAIASGTVPTARLGSGTANSTTYLRGDQTWATPAGGLQIDTNTSSGATNYAVGVTMVGLTGGVNNLGVLFNSSLTLYISNTAANQTFFSTTTPGGYSSLSGTWRCRGSLINDVGAFRGSDTNGNAQNTGAMVLAQRTA